MYSLFRYRAIQQIRSRTGELSPVTLLMSWNTCILENIAKISQSDARVCSSHVAGLSPTETLVNGRFLVSCSNRHAISVESKDGRNAKQCRLNDRTAASSDAPRLIKGWITCLGRVIGVVVRLSLSLCRHFCHGGAYAALVIDGRSARRVRRRSCPPRLSL